MQGAEASAASSAASPLGKKGSGKEAKDIRSGEASDDYIAFKLEPFAGTLREGRNVIAIEGHNSKLESSDFTLDPFLFSADWPDE